jgi:hypothetical protein
MKVKCNQVIVPGEILVNSSISIVNIGYTILIKDSNYTHAYVVDILATQF